MKKPPQSNIIITGEPYRDIPSHSDSRSSREDIDYVPNHDVAFGYKSMTIYDTTTKVSTPLSRDDDKFIVYSENFESARSEFWARWKQYVQRRFNRDFIPIMLP